MSALFYIALLGALLCFAAIVWNRRCDFMLRRHRARILRNAEVALRAVKQACDERDKKRASS